MNHLKFYASFSTAQLMCLSCVGLTKIDVSFTMSRVADYLHSEKHDQQKTDLFYSFSVTCETIILFNQHLDVPYLSGGWLGY